MLDVTLTFHLNSVRSIVDLVESNFTSGGDMLDPVTIANEFGTPFPAGFRWDCESLRLGKNDVNGTFTAILSECRTDDTWTGRCCTVGICQISSALPCSKDMKALAMRLSESEFQTPAVAREHAFLNGLTPVATDKVTDQGV